MGLYIYVFDQKDADKLIEAGYRNMSPGAVLDCYVFGRTDGEPISDQEVVGLKHYYLTNTLMF